jgi:hypothetical protein
MFDAILSKITPSTIRGLVAIAVAAGVILSPDQITAIVAAGMAAIGLVNVFRRSSK